MSELRYSDEFVRNILTQYTTIAMVGASANETRPSYFAMKYMLAKGYQVIPVNPGQAGKTILKQKTYASLHNIPHQVEIVDIFRAPSAALDITKQAIDIGAKVVWMQLGVINETAARLAEEAGLQVVMDRCPKIEYGRLSGEISWAGVNARVISSRRQTLNAKGVQNKKLS